MSSPVMRLPRAVVLSTAGRRADGRAPAAHGLPHRVVVTHRPRRTHLAVRPACSTVGGGGRNAEGSAAKAEPRGGTVRADIARSSSGRGTNPPKGVRLDSASVTVVEDEVKEVAVRGSKPASASIDSERERQDGSNLATAVSSEVKEVATAPAVVERNDGLRALKKKVLWSLERVAINLFDSLGGHAEGEGPDDRKRHDDEKNMSDIGHALFNSVAIACIGAFLFGYHSGVMNAPLESIARDLGFEGDTVLKGAVVTVMIVGGVIGGVVIGPMSDSIGRRTALGVTCVPLMAGPLISGLSGSLEPMIIGRFLTGIGIGASSALVPLYLSEIAPTRIRGGLGSVRRVAFVIGCLAALGLPHPSMEPGWWRWLFLGSAVPAALCLVGVVLEWCEESPTWLLVTGSYEQSRRSLACLQNIRGREAVEWQRSVHEATQASLGDSKGANIQPFSPFRHVEPRGDNIDRTPPKEDDGIDIKVVIDSVVDLFRPNNRRPVVIGLGLCMLAAFSGSNTIIYYASCVFAELGLEGDNLLTWAVAIPNIAGALIALVLTDRWGRKPLLFVSFGAMTVSLIVLSATTSTSGVKEAFPGLCQQYYLDTQTTAKATAKSKEDRQSFMPSSSISASSTMADSADTRATYLSAICSDYVQTEILLKRYTIEPINDVMPTPAGMVRIPGFGTYTYTALAAFTCVPVYVCAFSVGAGPIPWLMYNEIFPTRIRARATAMCTAMNYASNVIVGSTFLPGIDAFGLSGVYGVYAVICGLGILFTHFLVIETKGLSLPEVEMLIATGSTKAASPDIAAISVAAVKPIVEKAPAAAAPATIVDLSPTPAHEGADAFGSEFDSEFDDVAGSAEELPAAARREP